MGAGDISLAGIKDKHIENLNILIEKSSQYSKLEQEMLQRIINRDNALIKLGEDANNVYADEEQDIGNIVNSYEKLEQAQNDIVVLEKTLHEQGQIYLSDIKGLSETTRQELLKFTNGNIDGRISKKNIREVLHKKDGLKDKENKFNIEVNNEVNDYLQKVSAKAEEAQQKVNHWQEKITEANEKIEQAGKNLTKERKKELESIEQNSVAYKELNDQEKKYIDEIDYAANCQKELNKAKKESAECNKILAQTEEQTRKELEKNLNQMNAAAQKIQQFISLSTGIIALGSSIDQFSKDAEEGNLSLSNYISIGTSAAMVTGSLFNTFEGLSGAATSAATSIASKLGVALSEGAAAIAGFIGTAGIAIGVVLALVLAFKGISNWLKTEHLKTIDGQFDSLTESVKNTKEALDDATNSLNQFTSNIQELEEGAAALEKMRKGTTEWKKALSENNKEVLDLLDNYGMLQKGNYTVDDDGIYHITDAAKQQIDNLLNDRIEQLNSDYFLQQAELKEATNKKLIQDYSYSGTGVYTYTGNTDVNGMPEYKDISKDVVTSIAKYLAYTDKDGILAEDELTQAVQEAANKYGVSTEDLVKQLTINGQINQDIVDASHNLAQKLESNSISADEYRKQAMSSLYADEAVKNGYKTSILNDTAVQAEYSVRAEDEKRIFQSQDRASKTQFAQEYLESLYGNDIGTAKYDATTGKYSVQVGDETKEVSEVLLAESYANTQLEGKLNEIIEVVRQQKNDASTVVDEAAPGSDNTIQGTKGDEWYNSLYNEKSDVRVAQENFDSLIDIKDASNYQGGGIYTDSELHDTYIELKAKINETESLENINNAIEAFNNNESLEHVNAILDYDIDSDNDLKESLQLSGLEDSIGDVEDLGDAIQEVCDKSEDYADSLKYDEKAANKVALAHKQMNKGVESLVSGYDD